MPTLTGTAMLHGVAQPNATVNAYRAERFARGPIPGQTSPDANPADATGTADTTGAFSLVVPVYDAFAVSTTVGASVEWQLIQVVAPAPPTTVTPQVGATQRVNAGYVASGQTAKSYVVKQALSTTATTTVTLETVTAGKTYVITDIFLSHDTSAVLDTRLQAAAVDIFRAPVKGDTAPCQMAGMETQPVAQAGQTVTLLYPIVAAATNAYAFISGVEQ